MPIPRYSLAEFRYGREEMLALIPTKDIKLPNCLRQFPHLIRENFQVPLALTPVTEDEQVCAVHVIETFLFCDLWVLAQNLLKQFFFSFIIIIYLNEI